MNRAHRRRHGRGSLTSWAEAIANSQPIPAEDVAKIMLGLRMAYQRLRDGVGDDDDFDRVAAALNVGLIRAESIGQLAVDAFIVAQSALMECDGIRGRHGRYGFRGDGIVPMNAAMDLYEQVLAMSSPNQMNAALQEGMRRMRAGQVHQPATH